MEGLKTSESVGSAAQKPAARPAATPRGGPNYVLELHWSSAPNAFGSTSFPFNGGAACTTGNWIDNAEHGVRTPVSPCGPDPRRYADVTNTTQDVRRTTVTCFNSWNGSTTDSLAPGEYGERMHLVYRFRDTNGGLVKLEYLKNIEIDYTYDGNTYYTFSLLGDGVDFTPATTFNGSSRTGFNLGRVTSGNAAVQEIVGNFGLGFAPTCCDTTCAGQEQSGLNALIGDLSTYLTKFRARMTVDDGVNAPEDFAADVFFGPPCPNRMSLDIVDPQGCYKEGDIITVQLNMACPSGFVNGYAAFLQYDDTILTFKPLLSAYNTSPPDPFSTHIQPMATSEISAGKINLDGSDVVNGPGTNTDRLLATLKFQVNALNDGATTNIFHRVATGGFQSELSLNGVPYVTNRVDSATFGIDQTDPEIDCPPDVGPVPCLSDVPAAATNLAEFEAQGGSASDPTSFCGGVSVTHVGDSSSGNCQTGQVTITRTYMATDTAGNTATCDQTITVAQDNIPPDIDSQPPTKFVDCMDEVPPPYADLDAAIANGLEVTDSCNMTLQLINTFQQGLCPTLIVRDYHVVDECGNYASFKDVIIVDDNDAPTIAGSNTSVSVDALCQATATLLITVEDNCGVLKEDVTVNISTAGLATFDLSSPYTKTQINPKKVEVSVSVPVSNLQGCTPPVTVTAAVSAMDACGNAVGPTNFTATVNDTTNPVASITVIGGNVDASCEKVVTFSGTVTDNCCINAASVTAVPSLTTGNATLTLQPISILQVDGKTISVSGSVLVSNLTSCPATVKVTVSGQDCCLNPVSVAPTANVNDVTPPTVLCSNITVPADAGGCTASVTMTASASDNCAGGPLPVSYFADLDTNGSYETPISNPYVFGQGTTNVQAQATDNCSNTGTCNFSVQVLGINKVKVTVILQGVSNSTSRCIRFIPTPSACAANLVNTLNFGGAPPVSAVDVLVDIPCGNYTGLCAKDEQHTLSDSHSISISGPIYVASGSYLLRGGDTDNDNDVDINDVTLFLFQFGTPAVSGGCPWNGTRDADFDDDGVRFGPDYNFLSGNWQQFTGCCNPTGWPLLAPPGGSDHPVAIQPAEAFELSVPVSRLSKTMARKVDLNSDGVVDVLDVELFETRNRLDHRLSNAIHSTLQGSASMEVARPESMEASKP